MFHRPSPRSRFAWITAAVLALLLLSAGSVAADTTPPADGKFTQNGTSAEVYTSTCTAPVGDTTTCSDVGLSVFAGKMSDSFSGVSHRNQVCAHITTYTIDLATGDYLGEPAFESGCQVDLPNGTVRAAKDLTSVKLATTTLQLDEYVCDEFSCEPVSNRDVTVGGTWTGVGPTSSWKYRSSSDGGTCRTYDSGKGSGREASFVGAVDGESLNGEAWITNGRFTFRSRCSEA